MVRLLRGVRGALLSDRHAIVSRHASGEKTQKADGEYRPGHCDLESRAAL